MCLGTDTQGEGTQLDLFERLWQALRTVKRDVARKPCSVSPPPVAVGQRWGFGSFQIYPPLETAFYCEH